MMISTRGRYALRVMIDLAEHNDGGYIAMKEVAERQGVSLKYLEKSFRSSSREIWSRVSTERAAAIGSPAHRRIIASARSWC